MANVSPKKFTTAFTMRVDDEFLRAVEVVRRSHDPVPSKSDAIRVEMLAAAARIQRKAAKRKEG